MYSVLFVLAGASQLRATVTTVISQITEGMQGQFSRASIPSLCPQPMEKWLKYKSIEYRRVQGLLNDRLLTHQSTMYV